MQPAVYLPAGRWINFHSNEWVTSTGQWIRNVPAYRDDILTLPACIRRNEARSGR